MTDLIALLLATLSGMLQPGVSEQQLEAKLAQAVLTEQPAPLKDVKVDVVVAAASSRRDGGTDAAATQLEKVEFRFTFITLDELVVDRATFTISGVKKNTATEGGATGKLTLSGISWSAAISDDALTTALRAEGGKMKSATVTIAPDGLTLRGKWPLAITRVSYGVTGNLEVDGSLLNFRIVKSDVSGIGVPGGINGLVEKEVNPVYDFARFAARSEKEIKLAKEKLNYDFKLRVKKIEPKAGHIIVYGSA